MAAVHQVVVGAAPGDAITEIALNTRELLRRCGFESEIFGWHIEPTVADEVTHAKHMPRARPDDLIIVHASYGCPELTARLLQHQERILLVHHNITPPHHFFAVDATFAAGLASGRAEVAALRPLVVRALAVSSFNADDLRSLGYHDVEVCPPVFDPWRVARQIADERIARDLADAPEPAFAWLSQILAHKRPDLAVNAHHVMVSHFAPDAQLYMIGTHRQPNLAEHVRRHIDQLRLPGASLIGRVDDRQLRAFLDRVTALLITSDHEGFCLPALEAMAIGVPVICREMGALPETVAGAALTLPASAGARTIASAMFALYQDPGARAQLREAGRKRAFNFTLEKNSARFLEHVIDVL